MKRIKLLLIGLLIALGSIGTYFATSNTSYAASMSYSIKCSPKTIYVGESTTCTVYINGGSGTSAGGEGNLSLSGSGSITGTSTPSGINGDFNTSEFSVYYDMQSGSLTIGTITVTGTSAGTVTISLTSGQIVDANTWSYVATSTAKASIDVIEKATVTTKTTQTTTQSINNTTTRTTTQSINNKTTKTTTAGQIKTTETNTTTTGAIQTTRVTDEYGNEITYDVTGTTTTGSVRETTDEKLLEAISYGLVLTSVKVGDFEVTYDNNGKYYATVNYDTESVEVTAEAADGITIVGQGIRSLSVGKNVVELVVKNPQGQSYVYQVIITRPEDTNEYNTLLYLLKVAGYNINFKQDKLEYTLYVNYDVDELYVIAEAENENTIITGDGLITLDSGENKIYVRVQYGDLSTTEYIIHVKRLNIMLILYIIIGILSAIIIGGVIFFFVYKKKKNTEYADEKNKIIADANRTVASSSTEGIKVSGGASSVIGTRPTVTPKVIATKVPTNPVAVATSAVKTVPVKTVTPTSSPEQVKVVKTVNTNTIPTNENYKDENVVINNQVNN